MSFPILSTALVLAGIVASSPFTTLDKRADTLSPVLNTNFPDPSIIGIGSGSWLAFATSGNNVRIQVAKSTTGIFGPWERLDHDMLPTPGNWSTGHKIWAPDVRPTSKGHVLYYTGQSNEKPNRQCIGSAVSTGDILGPYKADPEPIACPQDQGGAIDPSGFVDTDGTRYVVYKIDGNSLRSGGGCGNGDPSNRAPTPLMLQEMDEDGTSKVGKPLQILDRDDNDGPLIEAPQLIHVNGVYILFFSSNCFSTTLYDISYATATSIKGPYTKAKLPLAVTDNPYQITAPGGAQATDDGTSLVFHARCDAGRCMFARNIKIEDKVVKFV